MSVDDLESAARVLTRLAGKSATKESFEASAHMLTLIAREIKAVRGPLWTVEQVKAVRERVEGVT